MKFIKNDNTLKEKNSEKCQISEYDFKDKDIDLGIATITGRYPDEGYGMNTKCKELIYVIEGSGKISFENSSISFSKGDTILIECNEKYYWEAEYCVVSMSCTPSWKKEQYKLVK